MWEFLINLWCSSRWQFRPNSPINVGFKEFFWTSKWTKTVNFGCIQNSKFWRIFQTLCYSYWKTTFVQNFSKIKQYLWELNPHPNTPPFSLPAFTKKGQFYGCWINIKNLEKTSQPQMLFWRNLSQVYIWIRSFIWQNLGA